MPAEVMAIADVVPGVYIAKKTAPELIGAALSRWLADAVHGLTPATGSDRSREHHHPAASPEGGH
jgi:hypothetical protein